jgi:hypothetical protein
MMMRFQKKLILKEDASRKLIKVLKKLVKSFKKH